MNKPLDRLKHHVTGAVERGEKTAITAVVSKHTLGPLTVKGSQFRTDYNVMSGDVFVASSINNPADAALFAAAPELLEVARELNRLLAEAGYGSKSTDLDEAAVTLALIVRKAEGE